jgi:hypothetical protein
MRIGRSTLLIAFGFVGSLTAGATWGHAQRATGTRAVQPVVVSGSDFGFRVEGRKGDTPVGRFVIRENGEWVTVEAPMGLAPLR